MTRSLCAFSASTGVSSRFSGCFLIANIVRPECWKFYPVLPVDVCLVGANFQGFHLQTFSVGSENFVVGVVHCVSFGCDVKCDCWVARIALIKRLYQLVGTSSFVCAPRS